MSNLYYSPEDFGLQLVKELSESNMSYSFNLICVWQHLDGNLYWAHDSGCSCPSPFEDFSSVGELALLDHFTFDAFSRFLKDEWQTDELIAKDWAEAVQVMSKIARMLGPLPTDEEIEAARNALLETYMQLNGLPL
mgnify:CR=1 FL=1